MFLILTFQVNFATRVHSKVGLAITGIVQLCCSAIMSLSVLALIGWNGWGWSSLPSSVPIWVLPMVIVVVGVENMSTMVSLTVTTLSERKGKSSWLKLHSDQSGILSTFPPLSARAYRAGSKSKRYKNPFHDTRKYLRPRCDMVFCRCYSCSRILRIRNHRQHHRLVHVAYFLSDRECHTYSMTLSARNCTDLTL